MERGRERDSNFPGGGKQRSCVEERGREPAFRHHPPFSLSFSSLPLFPLLRPHTNVPNRQDLAELDVGRAQLLEVVDGVAGQGSAVALERPSDDGRREPRQPGRRDAREARPAPCQLAQPRGPEGVDPLLVVDEREALLVDLVRVKVDGIHPAARDVRDGLREERDKVEVVGEKR